MARDDGFLEYLHELLDPHGHVATRRMFGGHGVYVDELFMAIVIDGRLYLKVDAETRARFEEAGSEPFVYTAKDAPVTMSYWSAPESAMDSAEEMASWAKLAIDAAARQLAAKKRASKKVPVSAGVRAPGPAGAPQARATAPRGSRPRARR